MTKRELKLYKQTKNQIIEINDTIDNLEYELQELCCGDDERAIKRTSKMIAQKLQTKYDLISYCSKLILPTHLVIKEGLIDCKDFLEDNKEMEMGLGSTIQEYCAMYLNDNYNHDLYGFNWAIKDNCNDIFVTRIRWFKKQLIKEDLKDILKGKTKSFKNRFVEISKHQVFKNTLTILHKSSGFVYGASYKKAIKYLESIQAL